MLYELIIKINIEQQYFIKSILSILNQRLNKNNNINEIQLIYDVDKNIYTINSELEYNDIHEHVIKYLQKQQTYIKNIYPEYGNDWYILFKIVNSE